MPGSTNGILLSPNWRRCCLSVLSHTVAVFPVPFFPNVQFHFFLGSLLRRRYSGFFSPTFEECAARAQFSIFDSPAPCTSERTPSFQFCLRCYQSPPSPLFRVAGIFFLFVDRFSVGPLLSGSRFSFSPLKRNSVLVSPGVPFELPRLSTFSTFPRPLKFLCF